MTDEGETIAEPADAPVAALHGVSEGDAEHPEEPFNIKTVRDLGTGWRVCPRRPPVGGRMRCRSKAAP